MEKISRGYELGLTSFLGFLSVLPVILEYWKGNAINGVGCWWAGHKVQENGTVLQTQPNPFMVSRSTKYSRGT